MRLFALGVELGNVVSVQRRHDADPREERRSAALDHQKQSFIAAQVKPASSFGAVPPFFTHMSIRLQIFVCRMTPRSGAPDRATSSNACF